MPSNARDDPHRVSRLPDYAEFCPPSLVVGSTHRGRRCGGESQDRAAISSFTRLVSGIGARGPRISALLDAETLFAHCSPYLSARPRMGDFCASRHPDVKCSWDRSTKSVSCVATAKKWKEDRIVLYIAIRVPSSDSNDLMTIIFNEPIAPMLAPSLAVLTVYALRTRVSETPSADARDTAFSRRTAYGGPKCKFDDRSFG